MKKVSKIKKKIGDDCAYLWDLRRSSTWYAKLEGVKEEERKPEFKLKSKEK